MSELERIFLTSALTIAGSVILLVFGQLILRFFIDPIQEQAKAIGETAYIMIFYADLYLNPGTGKPEMGLEAADALRKNASRLIATSHAIRAYWFWVLLCFAPPLENVLTAARKLIFLSNSVSKGHIEENESARKEIVRCLRLLRTQMPSLNSLWCGNSY